MKTEDIGNKIAPYVKEGKISCKKAFEFTDKEDISTRAPGKALNELKIKATTCQLGGFP